jgi:hypothetical protein
VPHARYEGNNVVQEYGKSCPQQALILPHGMDELVAKIASDVVNRFYEAITPEDEDCKGCIISFIAPSSAVV